MANPSLDLRGGTSGPTFEGSTPGHVLTIDADGKHVSPQPVPVAPGGLVSFNGRTAPAVIPTAGDYGTDDVTNTSSVPGLTDEDALEFLLGETETLELEVTAAAAAAAAAQTTANGAASAAATAQTTANGASAAAATADAKAVAAQQPFRANFYVDPLFAGTSTGSQSSPFKTFVAAFAAAAALALAAGTVSIPPGSTINENVTVPPTGEWTLQGLTSPGGTTSCNINGNVDVSATAARRCWLRDVRILGNLTGNTSAGTNRITLERVGVVGTSTLTISGSGFVRVGTQTGTPGLGIATSNMGGCFFTGAVAIQGTMFGSTATFTSTLSCSGRCTFFNCFFGGNITTTAHVADDNDLVFDGCATTAAISINISQTVGGRLALIAATDTSLDSATINFSGIGINVFQLDAASANSLFQHGATLTGAVANGAGTMARARLTAQSNNIGVSLLAAKSPIPQTRVNGTLTLVTPGTAGNALLNVTYIDSLGVSRTKPVTPALNIAGVAGDEVQGSLLFTQNGSANFQYSVTGITTPGALSYNLAISIEPAQ